MLGRALAIPMVLWKQRCLRKKCRLESYHEELIHMVAGDKEHFSSAVWLLVLLAFLQSGMEFSIFRRPSTCADTSEGLFYYWLARAAGPLSIDEVSDKNPFCQRFREDSFDFHCANWRSRASHLPGRHPSLFEILFAIFRLDVDEVKFNGIAGPLLHLV